MEDKRMKNLEYLDEAIRITDEIIKLWEMLGIDVENASFEKVIKCMEEQEKKKKEEE